MEIFHWNQQYPLSFLLILHTTDSVYSNLDQSPLLPPNEFYKLTTKACPGVFEFKLLQLAPHIVYGTASNFSNLDFANHQIVETPMLLSRRCPHPTRDTFEKCLQYKVIETLRLLSFKQVEQMPCITESM